MLPADPQMSTFPEFALSLSPSLAHCVCEYVLVSFPFGGVSATFNTAGHLCLIGTVSSLGLGGATLLRHSPFCEFFVLLLRAERSVRLSPGASSSRRLPQVTSLGCETLTFYLQPGMPPSTTASSPASRRLLRMSHAPSCSSDFTFSDPASLSESPHTRKWRILVALLKS